MDINSRPIKTFLDAIDKVLNSNTFLLQFESNLDNLKIDIESFIKSELFIQQITIQDRDNRWFNFQYFDKKTKSIKLRTTIFPNKHFELNINERESEKYEYLESMLNGSYKFDNFQSFYGTELEVTKAKEIVYKFTVFITEFSNWQFYTLETNFYDSYFEGYGNDSASIILTNEKVYLLLTNGMD